MGELGEWFKPAVLKTADVKASVSSNLTLSAGSLEMVPDELTDGSLLSPCGTSVRVDQRHYLCYRSDRLDLPTFVAFREWILDEGSKSSSGGRLV